MWVSLYCLVPMCISNRRAELLRGWERDSHDSVMSEVFELWVFPSHLE